MTLEWCTTMQPFTTLLLCLFFIVFSTCSVLSLNTNNSFHEADEVLNKKMIKEYLMKINKPAQKTIKSPDGDLIDCVLFHKQPAFDHPLLKGNIPMEVPKKSKRFYSEKSFQLWNTNGEECPEETVPIRRITEEEILRAKSLKRFMMKPTPGRKPKAVRKGEEFAVGVVDMGAYFGASADLNVWAPHVDNNREFSSSQIWLTSDGHNDDLNIIEAGWQVYPKLYKDNQTRLFTFWTTDSSIHTGCFDLLCSGFVHTNPKIALGSAITPLSSYDGRSQHITLSIEKDEFTENWFLLYGPKKEDIGYWPKQLLPKLGFSASYVEFGGEVLNTASSGVHTSTQMGSGHMPSEGYTRAAYVANIDIIGLANKSIILSSLNKFVSNPDCYDVSDGDPKLDPQLGYHFFYGGPGRGFRCP